MDKTEKDCKETRQQLNAYYDGELNASAKAEITQHLAKCADCRVSLTEIARVVNTVKAMPSHAVPSRLSAKLDSLVEQQSPVLSLDRARQSNNGTSRQRPAAAWIAVAAAAAVAIFVGVKHFSAPVAPPAVADKPPVKSVVPNNNSVQKQVIPAKAIANGVKPTLPVPDKRFDKQSPQLANRTASPPAAKDVEPEDKANEPVLAELPSDNRNLNDAMGIATDEDGLYDIKM